MLRAPCPLCSRAGALARWPGGFRIALANDRALIYLRGFGLHHDTAPTSSLGALTDSQPPVGGGCLVLMGQGAGRGDFHCPPVACCLPRLLILGREGFQECFPAGAVRSPTPDADLPGLQTAADCRLQNLEGVSVPGTGTPASVMSCFRPHPPTHQATIMHAWVQWMARKTAQLTSQRPSHLVGPLPQALEQEQEAVSAFEMHRARLLEFSTRFLPRRSRMFVVHTPDISPRYLRQEPPTGGSVRCLVWSSKALVRPDAQPPARCRTARDSPRWPASVPTPSAKQQRCCSWNSKYTALFGPTFVLTINQYLYAIYDVCVALFSTQPKTDAMVRTQSRRSGCSIPSLAASIIRL